VIATQVHPEVMGAAALALVHAQRRGDANDQTGFLVHLALRGLRRRLTGLEPAFGQRPAQPCVAIPLQHDRDPPVSVENHSAGRFALHLTRIMALAYDAMETEP